MRITRHMAAALAVAAGMALFGLAPTAPAAAASHNVINIFSSTSYQYYPYCDEADSPPVCNLRGSEQLVFEVDNSNNISQSITVGYQIVNGSAVDGTDFNIPMTGTITVPAHQGTGGLIVPVVNEGAPDATETFTVELTSSSLPATLGGPATGTIYSQAEVPQDCSLGSTGSDISMTCTARPAGQTWHEVAPCAAFGVRFYNGNTVTGDGTSTVNCPYPLGTAQFATP
jgi:hypothetical protein